MLIEAHAPCPLPCPGHQPCPFPAAFVAIQALACKARLFLSETSLQAPCGEGRAQVAAEGSQPDPWVSAVRKAALGVCKGGGCLANWLAVQLPNPRVPLHMKVLQGKL